MTTSDVIKGIYDAAIAKDYWGAAVDAFCRMMRAKAGMLYDIPHEDVT